MMEEELFSVKDFAKLARTTRDTLHYYDSIGLLPPAARGKNNYRYYTTYQLGIFNFIRTLQMMGMSLDEIREIENTRTPQITDVVLSEQLESVQKKIAACLKAQQLLQTLQKVIRSGIDIDESAITLEELEAEPILLGELIDYSKEQSDYSALVSFYHDISQKYPNADLNYPVWGIHTEERVKKGDLHWPSRYYLYTPDGPDERPAGQYLIGYTRGSYGSTQGLYKRLFKYANEHGLEVYGNAYEEYPLNEICISNHAAYLIRGLIAVRKKSPQSKT